MLVLNNQWNLLDWFRFLESINLQIGRDYSWAWHAGNWAIRLHDPQSETLVLLHSTPNEVRTIEDIDDSAAV